MIIDFSQLRALMLVNQQHPVSLSPRSLVFVGGQVLLEQCAATALNQLMAELSRISPAEILALGIPQKLKPFQIVPDEKIILPNCITQFYNITTFSLI